VTGRHRAPWSGAHPVEIEISGPPPPHLRLARRLGARAVADIDEAEGFRRIPPPRSVPQQAPAATPEPGPGPADTDGHSRTAPAASRSTPIPSASIRLNGEAEPPRYPAARRRAPAAARVRQRSAVSLSNAPDEPGPDGARPRQNPPRRFSRTDEAF
jgi:hypothetical protein